jgi:hypothetical protein
LACVGADQNHGRRKRILLRLLELRVPSAQTARRAYSQHPLFSFVVVVLILDLSVEIRL